MKRTRQERSNGQEFDFIGVKKTGSPAPYGVHWFVTVNGDTIEALPDFLIGTFCG